MKAYTFSSKVLLSEHMYRSIWNDGLAPWERMYSMRHDQSLWLPRTSDIMEGRLDIFLLPVSPQSHLQDSRRSIQLYFGKDNPGMGHCQFMRKLCKIEEIRLQIWKGPLYNIIYPNMQLVLV